MHRFRRNDIVLPANGEMYRFYGRVNRRIDADHVEVIDCGKHITIYKDSELELHNDYWGYSDIRYRYDPDSDRDEIVWSRTRWIPSLRRLKQRAAYYQPAVWKKYRKQGHQIRYYQGLTVNSAGQVVPVEE